MGLDFSKLENIAYRGFDGEKARADKDALIEQGFTILEEPTPFDKPEGTAAQSGAAPDRKPIMSGDVIAPTTTPAQAAQAETRETGSPSARTAQGASQSATQRPQRAFTAPTDTTRDYRAMYAALFRFHERHNPPTPGDDDGALYWSATTDDMTATAQRFDNDPFMVNLLCVVFGELESEYKAMRQQATGA